MFEKKINVLLKECREELLKTKDEKMQDVLQEMKSLLSEDEFKKVVENCIKPVIATSVVADDTEEMMGNDMFLLHALMFNLNNVKMAYHSLVLDVKVRGMENAVNRIMEVPYLISAGNLACMVLAALEADGEYLYELDHEGFRYVSNGWRNRDDNTTKLADLTPLINLNLDKGSRFELFYDVEDRYCFDIVIKEIKENKEKFDYEKAKVLEGTGFGIWNDEHFLLEMYLEDKDKFFAYCKEQDFDLDWYPINKTFDIDRLNEELSEKFMLVMDNYQSEEDLWDEEFMDDEEMFFDEDFDA